MLNLFPLAIIIIFAIERIECTINGKYTENIENEYHLVIPHKASSTGEFATFHLPHTHRYDATKFSNKRKKRELAEEADLVHYGLMINNKLQHLELEPIRDLLHPQVAIEWRDPTLEIDKRQIKGIKNNKKMCYYHGHIRGIPKSQVALSTCNGLTGFIRLGDKMYFIEPVAEHTPNEEGHHLHVLHRYGGEENTKKNLHHHPFEAKEESFCGIDDSDNAWKKEMKKRLMYHRSEDEHNNNIFKRVASINSSSSSSSSSSKSAKMLTEPQYIETLIVVDKSLIVALAGKHDVEEFILTNYAMVKAVYQGESMPFVIQPVIVRIIYLQKREKEIDLKVHKDLHQSLVNFCKWTMKLQKEESHPNHFDIALFLSAEDYCTVKGKEIICTPAGLATSGGACSGQERNAENCELVEANGLLTFTRIAHETGHLLGMQHDAWSTPCAANSSDNSWFVMSPIENLFTHSFSKCSIAAMKALADNGLLECLGDEPGNNDHTISDILPGVVYGMDDQCEFYSSFLNSTGACKREHFFRDEQDVYCDKLLCLNNDGGGCAEIDAIAVDGTTCNKDKWCIRAKCVPKGTRGDDAINGDWGEWGEWSNCTRSCNRGTQYRERVCDNPKPANGGALCGGSNRQIRICNPHECPPDQKPFRELECERMFKKRPDEKLKYSFFNRDTPCELWCTYNGKNGEELTSQISSMITDGAKCDPTDSLKMCIEGKCAPVSCDNFIEGSKAVLDRCGVCNGAGDLCKLNEGNLTVQSPSKIQVLTVPAGGKNVKIIKTNGTGQIGLGLPDNKTIYFNNDTAKEMPSGVYPLGSKKRGYFDFAVIKLGNDKEILLKWFNTREDIGIYLIPISPKSSEIIYYHWTEPIDSPISQPKYRWDITEFNECNVKCGGGMQVPIVSCYEEKAGKISDTFCENEKLEKPTETAKKCNEQPCIAKWKVGIWGKCRACKKKGGVQVREVQCLKTNPNPLEDDILVENAECKAPKPGTVKLCQTVKKCGIKKRKSTYVPGRFQDTVWNQMNKIHLEKRGAIKPKIPLKAAPYYPTTTTEFWWKPSNIKEYIHKAEIDEVHDKKIILEADKTVAVNDTELKNDEAGHGEEETVIIKGTTRIITGRPVSHKTYNETVGLSAADAVTTAIHICNNNNSTS